MTTYSLYTTSAATGLLRKRAKMKRRVSHGSHTSLQNAVCFLFGRYSSPRKWGLEEICEALLCLSINLVIWTIVLSMLITGVY